MKKAIATALIASIGIMGLTACGGPSEPEYKATPKKYRTWEMTPKEEAEFKAEQAKEKAEELFWSHVSQVVDDYHSADEFGHEREVPEKAKAIKAGWKACRDLEKTDGDEESARNVVSEYMGLELDGKDSDKAASIVYGAEWGMCQKFA